uniref:Uncharacterized protein n=1 Tax=Lygus hesperus TaxID=30085 RepID=A0A146LEU3_LYGHE
MPCDLKAGLKAIEVIVCGLGLFYKVMTTWEAGRVELMMQKMSREWSWANYTHATSTASIFLDITFGAFFIITLASFLGHISGDPKTHAESIMMVIGFIFMVAAGGLLVISSDDVPHELMDNTVVLAVLALLAGVLFLADAGTKCATKKRVRRETPRRPIIEIVPKEQPNAEPSTSGKQVAKVEGPSEEETKEDTTDAKPIENGIKSVEIRIKDPKKNWAVYGDTPPFTRTQDLDVLQEAEAVDRMLTEEQFAMGRARGQLPRLHQSPLRHTSSFYISPAPQFSWKRLSEKS